MVKSFFMKYSRLFKDILKDIDKDSTYYKILVVSDV